jgi:hypothetical protein
LYPSGFGITAVLASVAHGKS